MTYGYLVTIHIAVALVPRKTAGRADFDKEKGHSIEACYKFPRKPPRIAGQNPITGLRTKGQYNSKAFHRLLHFGKS